MDLVQFKNLDTIDHLAAQLGYSYDELSALIYGPSSLSSYRIFQVAKKSGGFRTIAAPRPELKAIQRQILEALTQAYQPTRSAFGFVRGRSIVGGARLHVGRHVVVNLDLADFFPTITFWRVRGLFMSTAFGRRYDVATVLAQICCRAGELPQGAPTSPIISNFICSAMDRELGALAGSCGGYYSRYCDDMTLSFDSNVVVEKSIATRSLGGLQPHPAIQNIINKHGFRINYAKFKVRTRRERQEVTGLIVNKRVNIRRSLVRRLHTQLHCIERYGFDSAAKKYCELYGIVSDVQGLTHFAAAIWGRVLFVKMIRGDGDPVFATLARRFNNLDIYPRKIKYYRRAQSIADLNKAIWVVEVAYDDPEWGFCSSQGTVFILEGVGFVTCAHVVVNDRSRRPFRKISVFRTGSSKRYCASVASFDPRTDIAILLIQNIDYVAECHTRICLSRLNDFAGQAVLMTGFPSYRDGQSLFVSRTEVASVHGDYIEIGGQVIGGISGGPLLDSEFRAVGILIRGVPGGGAKNEAIVAKKAFYLNFKCQDLSLLEPARRSPPVVTRSRWRAFLAWLQRRWRG